MSGEYDVAQVCLNGHVITERAKYSPEHLTKFCDRCGEATTMICAECSTSIRGEYLSRTLVVGGGEPTPPAFCHNCGKPYPWTQAGIRAAQELTAELMELTPEERDQLAKTLPDLIRDTPRTGLAAARFKRLVTKAGPVAVAAFGKILANFAAEGAKTIMFGKQP